MKLTKLSLVILAVLMISACAGTPITPRLPIPEKPTKELQKQNFTPDELFILRFCSNPKKRCIIADNEISKDELIISLIGMVKKGVKKKILYQQYSTELLAVIIDNNRLAQ